MYTLTITTTKLGLDPGWNVRFMPSPPASLKPGEIIMLHLGFIGPSAQGSMLPASAPGISGDFGRVEVGILLDDVLVGGVTVELKTHVNYLPMLAR